MPDPLQWLQHLAALTTRVRLGTGLMILPLHNPLILAKRLATLDRLSGDRAEATAFSGRFHAVDDLHVRPLLARSAGIPLIVGG
ncbi:LLM class flavin-dependent oxidoreductase [Microbacterium aurantiacum]|uniref:LLM class flavin-dependent oxidoreductase n=1 Tax=Microbacterium aurantiacum TaxID=162393 RepID=UPI003D7635FA